MLRLQQGFHVKILFKIWLLKTCYTGLTCYTRNMKKANYNYIKLENIIYMTSLVNSLNPEEREYFNQLLTGLRAYGINDLCLDDMEVEDKELNNKDLFAEKYQELKDNSLFIIGQEKQMCRLTNLGYACLGYGTDNGSRVILSFQDIDYDFINRSFHRLSEQPWIILESPRCILRELTLGDLDDLYDLHENKTVREYVEPLFVDRDKEIEFQRSYIEGMYGLYELGLWLIFSQETDELIGRAGIEFREYEGQNVIELGYMVADSYQRRGIAFEVCQKIIDYIRNNYEYKELYCFIENDNKASLGLAEKLGFNRVGKCPTIYMDKAVELAAFRMMLN